MLENISTVELKTLICKLETKQLLKEQQQAKQEVKRITAVPLIVGWAMRTPQVSAPFPDDGRHC